jgi:hypothetical protein
MELSVFSMSYANLPSIELKIEDADRFNLKLC